MNYLLILFIVLALVLCIALLKNKKKAKIFLFIFSMLTSSFVVDASAMGPTLNGEYVYVYDLTDDHMVYEKNGDQVIYPASMTKVMTVLVALENMENLDTVATIEKYDLKGLWEAGASVANFEVGEKVTYRDLIHGILLPSGADACRATSRILFGSEEAMAEEMNKKAQELGLKNTHFVNTSGLHDDNHYTTVEEMAIITKEALKDDFFREVFSKGSYRTEISDRYMASTLLKFKWKNNVSISHIEGGKTGYTSKSKSCLTCLVESDGKELIAVFAHENGSSKYVADAKTVKDYYTENYENVTLFKKGDVLKTIEVKDGVKESYDLIAYEDINVYLPNNVNKEDITYQYKGVEQLVAPTNLQDSIGEFAVVYDGEVLKSYDFYVEEEIDATTFVKIYRFVKIHIVEITASAVGIALFVFIFTKYRKKKRSY